MNRFHMQMKIVIRFLLGLLAIILKTLRNNLLDDAKQVLYENMYFSEILAERVQQQDKNRHF